MRTTNLKASGVVLKRYQQLVGNTEVLGGKLTVLNNAKGETVAAKIIGNTGGTGEAVVISNVSSKILKGVKFQISWNTNVPSSTGVTFICCDTYVKNELVTNHAYTFSGYTTT